MELARVLQFERCPFDVKTLSRGLEITSQKEFLAEKVQFCLFLQYMKRMIEQCNFQISFPEWKYYPERTQGRLLYSYSAEVIKYKKLKSQIMTEFFFDIMTYCGWEISNIQTEEMQEWERIFSCLPDFHKLEEQGFYDIRAIICCNKALYDYYDFCKKNKELIKEQFLDASEVIAQILRKTADPFLSEWVETRHCFKEQKYIIGFFETNHNNMAVSILNMDYNFLVQILILYMLIKCAERQFGYR